jgi:hypothetical protein
VQYHLNTGSATNDVDYGTPTDNDANPNDGLATFSTTGASNCTDPAGPRTTCVRVTVPVINDSLVEPDEDFFLNLTDPTGASIGDGQGRAVIVNDDEAAPPPACMAIDCLDPATLESFKQYVCCNIVPKVHDGLNATPPKPFKLPLWFDLLRSNLSISFLVLYRNFRSFPAGAAAGSAVIGQASANAGQTEATFVFSKAGKKLLRKTRKATFTLTVTVTDSAGKSLSSSSRVKYKRKKKKKK